MKGFFFSISIITTIIITGLLHPYETAMLWKYGFHLNGILITLAVGATAALSSFSNDKTTALCLSLLGGAVICLLDLPISIALGAFIAGFLAGAWLNYPRKSCHQSE